ncbi:MAG: hypothetical protein ACLTSZ_05925 [Lachnospiraceae bacterium]
MAEISASFSLCGVTRPQDESEHGTGMLARTCRTGTAGIRAGKPADLYFAANQAKKQPT